MPDIDRSPHKAARLAALLAAGDQGLLAGRTLQEIGDLLDVDRSTILRDLRQVSLVRELTGVLIGRLRALDLREVDDYVI